MLVRVVTRLACFATAKGTFTVRLPLTQRQHRVLRTIEHFIRDEGYTPSVREIGTVIGLAPATVQQHLDALVRKGYLRRTGQSHGLAVLAASSDPGIVHVPIIGEIAAGEPIEAYEEQIDTVTITRDVAAVEDAFALRVRGDSMVDDHICDGDIVIVEPSSSVRDGEIAVALLEDNTATLKRVYREGARVRLQPANATMAPIYADARTLQVRGRVVAVVRTL